MTKRKPRPQLRIVGHYRMIDGIKTAIDPFKTDIPDRCKLVVAEIATGQKLSFAENEPDGEGGELIANTN